MSIEISLKGKTAIVTGASRGIGLAIAECLAKAGANVVVASRKIESVKAVADKINASGGKATAVACHIGMLDQLDGLFKAAMDAYGAFDILVNNAATNPTMGPAISCPPEIFDKIYEVNIKGYYYATQKACQLWVDSDRKGSIINIASVAGLRPAPMLGPYSVSKAAVIGLTRVFARELAGAGIRINAIAPGLVETKFAAALIDNPDVYKLALAGIPLGRHGQPEEIAGAVLYLASDMSSFVTGETLVVDGGAMVA